MVDKISLNVIIQKIQFKIVAKVKVDDDLQRYVQDVKETIKILLQV